jgi:hypothetical protein
MGEFWDFGDKLAASLTVELLGEAFSFVAKIVSHPRRLILS